MDIEVIEHIDAAQQSLLSRKNNKNNLKMFDGDFIMSFYHYIEVLTRKNNFVMNF